MQANRVRRAVIGIALSCVAFSCVTGAALAQGAPAAAGAPKPRVELQTSMGHIVIELDAAKAPITVDNFLKYVKSGQYSGTIFHRVIEGFMIQGGGFTPKLVEKPTRAPIKIESSNGLKNTRGTVAMARTSDPNSATSQFFINVVDNARLDYPGRDGFGYTVFGEVVEGMDVVDKIRAVPTGPKNPLENVPLTPILIEKATLLK